MQSINKQGNNGVLMMTLYAVYRLDRTDGLATEIRTKTRNDHRAYMAQFSGRVHCGGPLLNKNGEGCGGLMLIEAESHSEVENIVNNDPFEKAGLSERIDILPFRWQTNRPEGFPPL